MLIESYDGKFINLKAFAWFEIRSYLPNEVVQLHGYTGDHQPRQALNLTESKPEFLREAHLLRQLVKEHLLIGTPIITQEIIVTELDKKR